MPMRLKGSSAIVVECRLEYVLFTSSSQKKAISDLSLVSGPRSSASRLYKRYKNHLSQSIYPSYSVGFPASVIYFLSCSFALIIIDLIVETAANQALAVASMCQSVGSPSHAGTLSNYFKAGFFTLIYKHILYSLVVWLVYAVCWFESLNRFSQFHRPPSEVHWAG